MARGRVLAKKLIVVLDTRGKTDTQKLGKYNTVCDGIDSDSIFSGITPATADTRVVISDIQGKIRRRDALQIQAIAMTADIASNFKDLNNTFVDDYCSASASVFFACAYYSGASGSH